MKAVCGLLVFPATFRYTAKTCFPLRLEKRGIGLLSETRIERFSKAVNHVRVFQTNY